MSSEKQAAALLALIQDYRDKECAEILQTAAQEARQIRKEALAVARKQVQAVIREARAQKARALQVHEAELEQLRRSRQQQQKMQLLAAGMPLLRHCLQEQWQQPTTRMRWVQQAYHQAIAILPAQDWQVVHPLAWPVEEQVALAQAVAEHGQVKVQFNPCNDLDAGLRICAADACLDATVNGLLRDRPAVEAQLLALFQERGG